MHSMLLPLNKRVYKTFFHGAFKNNANRQLQQSCGEERWGSSYAQKKGFRTSVACLRKTNIKFLQTFKGRQEGSDLRYFCRFIKLLHTPAGVTEDLLFSAFPFMAMSIVSTR